jgi:SWI/SNF-related matrix-associated actin-dependent regulator of chromatin subfamily A member 5
MFAITWWFVILDEAHRVANPETNISVAVRELPGKYRLPITGTPLQNDYTDVQGLLAFMHVNPWSDLEYFRQVSVLNS